jgi:hypothetical protein
LIAVFATLFLMAAGQPPRLVQGLCTAEELGAAREAQVEARQRVLAAVRFFGSDRPAARVLRKLTLGSDPDRDRAEERLLLMYSYLARAELPLRCAGDDEAACEADGGALLACDGGVAVPLCPRFFKQGLPARAKALIHAAAHLAGLGSTDKRADAWALLVQRVPDELSGSSGETAAAGSPPDRSRLHR